MLTDAELTQQLAALMGWEVVGPELAGVDHAPNKVYIDRDGRYWRATDGPRVWVEWKPLVDMNDAMQIVRALQAAGWEYACGSCAGGDYVRFSREDPPRSCTAIAQGLARAIAEAALKTTDYYSE